MEKERKSQVWSPYLMGMFSNELPSGPGKKANIIENMDHGTHRVKLNPSRKRSSALPDPEN
jgi:hypothetical protein